MLSSMVIIVADDDRDDDFRLTEIALRNAGRPQLRSARNLREARALMKAPDVTVMLLDRRIPIDGTALHDCMLDEWCDFISEASLHCSVLVYTGHPSSEDEERSRLAGAMDYLNKAHCQAYPDPFAQRIRDASDFYLRNKTALEGQLRLEALVRANRSAFEALRDEIRDELQRVSGTKAKEVYKAGRRDERKWQERIKAGKSAGEKVGAWLLFLTMAAGAMEILCEIARFLINWVPWLVAFIKAAKSKVAS